MLCLETENPVGLFTNYTQSSAYVGVRIFWNFKKSAYVLKDVCLLPLHVHFNIPYCYFSLI